MVLVEFLSTTLTLAGFVVGLGAVTVIDLHGFLARKSSYWTQATIRTHKVTKPLIWIGIVLVVCGIVSRYRVLGTDILWPYFAMIALGLVVNGSFLTFVVSPALLRAEREGRDRELLPARMQWQITASFIVSVIGWWSALGLFAWQLTMMR